MEDCDNDLPNGIPAGRAQHRKHHQQQQRDAQQPPAAGNAANANESLVAEKFQYECRKFIDLLDKMKLCGLPDRTTHTLPSVVVVGDQSAGKSSLLESLSGISLPKGDGMTTKCPLEMVLREEKFTSKWHATLRYNLGENVSKKDITSAKNVGEAIQAAQNDLIPSETVTGERLILEVHGKDLPNVTLIDLPGLIAAEKTTNAPGTKEQLLRMTREYMSKETNIIVAVLDASKDFETNLLVEQLKEADPNGNRTIAVFTKYDVIEEGRKRKLLEELQSGAYPIRNYTIVRSSFNDNRDRDLTIAEKRRREAEYFANEEYLRGSGVDYGMEAFSTKIVKTLVKNIQSNIQGWSESLDEHLLNIKREIRNLPRPVPQTDDDKQFYLAQICKQWLSNVTNALTTGFAFMSMPDTEVQELGGEQVETNKVSLFYIWTETFREYSQKVRKITEDKFKDNGDFHADKLKIMLKFGIHDIAPSFQVEPHLKRIISSLPVVYREESLSCLDKIRQQLTKYLCTSIDCELGKEHQTFLGPVNSLVMEHVEDVYNKTVERINELFEDIKVMYFAQPDVYKKRLEAVAAADDVVLLQNNLKACFEISDSHLELGIPACIRMSMHINFIKSLEVKINKQISCKEFLDTVSFDHSHEERKVILEKRREQINECQLLIQDIRRGSTM